MDDCRLKTGRISLKGTEYILCCNFNVLADLQGKFGDLNVVLNLPIMELTRQLLAAMLNEYADSKGWEKNNYTAREAGRLMPTKADELNECMSMVVGLFRDAIMAEEVPEGSEKN